MTSRSVRNALLPWVCLSIEGICVVQTPPFLACRHGPLGLLGTLGGSLQVATASCAAAAPAERSMWLSSAQWASHCGESSRYHCFGKRAGSTCHTCIGLPASPKGWLPRGNCRPLLLATTSDWAVAGPHGQQWLHGAAGLVACRPLPIWSSSGDSSQACCTSRNLVPHFQPVAALEHLGGGDSATSVARWPYAPS